ncbi:MAG TPA: TonB-dependent receptor [Burkholderiaceae bacterium]|nr:TonB-dependent receptor [Burkholderiaceae bacterium]
MSRSPLRQQRQEHAKSPFAIAPVAAAAVLASTMLGQAHAQSVSAAAPAASAASAPDAANEAPALDAVTVHSRNRIERLQDVPISVSVTTGAELARLDAYGVDAITKRAANVSWNRGNQRTSSLSIRGIGKIGQTEAQDPSVGVIVDGVSYAYNALTSSFDFVDVDTVEVARGPQGTLQGKNASVGSITINYKRPSFTPTADYTLAFSEHNGLLGVAAIGGPVVDNLLAWRGTFSVDRQKGALVNAYDRDQSYTNTDRVSGRVQFLLTPSDDLSVRVEGVITPRASETTNGATINRPNLATTYSNGTAINTTNTNEAKLARSWFAQDTGYTLADYYGSPNNDAQRGLVTGNGGASAEVNWKLAGGSTLTSITALETYHFNAHNDDGTPFDITRNAGGFWNDYRQKSEELRITSPTGGFVDYQAGLFLMQARNSATYHKAWGNDAGAWYASPSQYTTLDATAAGQLLMENSLANVSMAYNSPAGQQEINNKSAAVYAQANWHVTDAFTVTTGARLTHEDRRTTASSYVISDGSAPELDPVSVNGVQLGGFDSDASTGALKGDNDATQVALADALAQKYFGVATYSALTAAQLKQVAAAKAIRQTNIGVLFNPVAAQPFRANQPAFTLSPSWKISPDVTSYVSYQHGEKAGISQVVNGISQRVDAEKTNAFELGVKSALLGKTLILNADVYDMRIADYQQAVRILDQYTTALNVAAGIANPTAYTSATGNVPKVDARGLEIDGVYGGIPRTTLRFSGAWNLARYKSFPNSAQPVENGYTGAPAYQDVSGRTLAGAPRLAFNVGADYRQPVSADKDAHLSANIAYSGKFNSDVSLSRYAVVGESVLADLSVGIGKHDKSFDASLIVKNVFNNQTPTARTWTSITPGTPRTFAVQFTGTL